MKTRRPRSSNSLAERLPSAKWPLLIRPPASASSMRPTPSASIVATAATLIEDCFMPSAFKKESPAPRETLEVWYGTHLASSTHSLIGRPPASRNHVPPAYCDNQVL